MRVLRRIWNDVRRGENIDLYTAVLLAFGLAIINLFGIELNERINSFILAILGLIAIAMVGTRHYLDSKLQSLANITTKGLRGRSLLPSFRNEGKDVSEIILVGVSLISAIIPNLDYFEDKLRKGCTIRFMFLDPQSEGMQSWHHMSPVPDVNLHIEQVVAALTSIIHRNNIPSSQCEIRLSPVYLPFGIVAFDPQKENGFMNVEINAYQRHPGDRPHLLLTRQQDTHWFLFFQDQYERLWKNSRALSTSK